jgi:hypothetical protein
MVTLCLKIFINLILQQMLFELAGGASCSSQYLTTEPDFSIGYTYKKDVFFFLYTFHAKNEEVRIVSRI